jgi:multimeric flavodoxin WrbA
MSDANLDFADLTALFINTTLTRSPGVSHTQLLIDASASIMDKQGVTVDQFRAVDYPIATGVFPDMREHGWTDDAWPNLFERVQAADILVIAGPIWLGDNSSETKKVIERL